MCTIPACPVLMDYGVLWEFELTGEHNGHANHIILVSQVENFDKSDTSEITEIFSPTSLDIQLFEVCMMSDMKTLIASCITTSLPPLRDQESSDTNMLR